MRPRSGISAKVLDLALTDNGKNAVFKAPEDLSAYLTFGSCNLACFTAGVTGSVEDIVVGVTESLGLVILVSIATGLTGVSGVTLISASRSGYGRLVVMTRNLSCLTAVITGGVASAIVYVLTSDLFGKSINNGAGLLAYLYEAENAVIVLSGGSGSGCGNGNGEIVAVLIGKEGNGAAVVLLYESGLVHLGEVDRATLDGNVGSKIGVGCALSCGEEIDITVGCGYIAVNVADIYVSDGSGGIMECEMVVGDGDIKILEGKALGLSGSVLMSRNAQKRLRKHQITVLNDKIVVDSLSTVGGEEIL
jgi:hypothetical protein